MSTSNGLVCFTNCLLAQEDGTLAEKDLWIDERRGVILNAQRTFFLRKERPARIVDLGGNVLSPGLIDIQINGAYGFDFSIYEGDDVAYRAGLEKVAKNIVETGVTSLVPTIITQERSLYPKLLHLLRPFSPPDSANLLGWHAEGPFLQMAKRGAHAPPFIISAKDSFQTFEEVYGSENLADREDWLMSEDVGDVPPGVRIITAAPEIAGVMPSVSELTKRGVVFSIGHSIATTDIATAAVLNGARLITHLFNAMPQLHHRDPSIIGLLGSSPHMLNMPTSASMAPLSLPSPAMAQGEQQAEGAAQRVTSEALEELETPPQTPLLKSPKASGAKKGTLSVQGVPQKSFERPFYEMIVDGVHSHPNSVRLAYSSYPEGCILITDAMKILDPHLKDGTHEWRDGQRFVKQGYKLFLEGTDTLAGSVVPLDVCVRNFSKFTGCALGEALACATYNPARCLGIENRKGTLRAGADADLVVMDRRGNVLRTWVKGREVWKKDA